MSNFMCFVFLLGRQNVWCIGGGLCPLSTVQLLLIVCGCVEMEKQDLNTYIGDMGPYQWRVFITVFIFAIYTADAIHIIFIAGKMPHWCHVPELNDLPYDVQKNVAIPAESVNCDGSIEYSSCEMFSLNYSIYNRSQFYSWNRSLIITNDTSVVECSQWTYDQSQFISTIVSKVWHVQIRDVPDIRFRLAGYPAIFFKSGSGSGSGQNGTRYRISQPDSARSFLGVSSPIMGWTFWFLTSEFWLIYCELWQFDLIHLMLKVVMQC